MKHGCLAAFIVFVLFFTIGFSIFDLQMKKFTSSDFILNSFDKSGLYTNLPAVVKEATSGQQMSQDTIVFQVIAQAIEPTYLRTQLETNLPPFVKYLNGKTKTLDVYVDLRPFKTAMGNKSPADIKKTISDILTAMPACTGDTQVKEGEIDDCLPVGTNVDTASANMAKQMQTGEFLNQIPDTYDFKQTIKNPDNYFGSARRSFRIFNISLIVLIALSVILLGVLALLGKDNWPSIFRWIGLAMLLPSGVMLLIDIIFKASINPIISACVAKTSAAVGTFLKPFITVFANQIFKTTLTYAGAVFFFGLVLLILSYIFHSQKEPSRNVQKLPQ